jgi:S-adenosylmethionine decarboxylase
MNGLHLTADLSGCDAQAAAMTDPDALRRRCLDAVREAGLVPVGELFHAFPPPGGVTGMVLLAESHVAVHTWPELGAVTLDAYVCNYGGDNSARAEALMVRLIDAFAPLHARRERMERGAVTKEPIA